MFRTLMTTTAAALMISTAAFAQDALTVKSVLVETDLQAVSNERAAAYWTTLSDDLTKAISERVANQLGEDGTDIKIDISEVELSNGFEEAMGLANTKLVGQVRMDNTTNPTRFSVFELTVDVQQAMPLMPAGTDITTLPADTRTFYEALVNAFAQAVVDRLV